jgi:hypothetical protein
MSSLQSFAVFSCAVLVAAAAVGCAGGQVAPRGDAVPPPETATQSIADHADPAIAQEARGVGGDPLGIERAVVDRSSIVDAPSGPVTALARGPADDRIDDPNHTTVESTRAVPGGLDSAIAEPAVGPT